MGNHDHGRFCLVLVANHICSSSLSPSGWSRRLPNRTIVLFLALPYCYIAFFLWEAGGEEEGGCCFSCAVAAMTSSSSLRFSCFIYDIFTGNHSLERYSTVVIGVVCLLHLLLFSLPVVASPDWAAPGMYYVYVLCVLVCIGFWSVFGCGFVGIDPKSVVMCV